MFTDRIPRDCPGLLSRPHLLFIISVWLSMWTRKKKTDVCDRASFQTLFVVCRGTFAVRLPLNFPLLSFIFFFFFFFLFFFFFFFLSFFFFFFFFSHIKDFDPLPAFLTFPHSLNEILFAVGLFTKS